MPNITVSTRMWEGLAIVAAILACFRFSLPLLEPEEARYAELSRQMFESKSWVVPTLDGQAYLDKPPLFYWLMATAYECLGVSVIVARIVPSLTASMTVWVVFRWGRAVGGVGAGVAAAWVLITTPDFLYRGPMVTMNGLLGLTTTASLAAGYGALMSGRLDWKWWLVSAGACALGVLAKGPASLVLVIGPILIVPWLDRRLAKPGGLAFLTFATVVVGIAGPWFAAVATREQGFLEYFFWKHHVERVFDAFDHVKPWWFYLPQVVLGTLPWTPVIAVAIYFCVRRRNVPALVPFGLVAGFFGLVLFSISGSKRPIYLVPIYPPLAVATGVFLGHEIIASGKTVLGLGRLGWTRIGQFTTFVFAIGMVFLLPWYHEHFSAGRVIEKTIEGTNDSYRAYAVPYGSPAASFALRRVVPTVALEQVKDVPPPTPGERVILFVPTRFVAEVMAGMKTGSATTNGDGATRVVIWIHAKEAAK